MASATDIMHFIGYIATVLNYAALVITPTHRKQEYSPSQKICINLINGAGFMTVYLSITELNLSDSSLIDILNYLGIIFYATYFFQFCKFCGGWILSIYKIIIGHVITHVTVIFLIYTDLVSREFCVVISSLANAAGPLTGFLIVNEWNIWTFELTLCILSILTELAVPNGNLNSMFLQKVGVSKIVLKAIYLFVCMVTIKNWRLNRTFALIPKERSMWVSFVEAGNSCYVLERFEDALLFYHQALKYTPRNLSIVLNYVEALIALGRLNEAFSECEDIVTVDPVNGPALSKLVLISLRLGSISNARKYLPLVNPEAQKALQSRIEEIEVHEKTWKNAWIAQDLDLALNEINLCVVKGLESDEMLAIKDDILLKKRYFEEAEKFRKKGISSKKD